MRGYGYGCVRDCEIARLRVRVFASELGCVMRFKIRRAAVGAVPRKWCVSVSRSRATIAAIQARVGFFLALLELNAASLWARKRPALLNDDGGDHTTASRLPQLGKRLQRSIRGPSADSARLCSPAASRPRRDTASTSRFRHRHDGGGRVRRRHRRRRARRLHSGAVRSSRPAQGGDCR